MTEDLEDDLSDLQQILALGNKEAADIVSEVTSKVYRCTFAAAVLLLQEAPENAKLSPHCAHHLAGMPRQSSTDLFCLVLHSGVCTSLGTPSFCREGCLLWA